MNLINITQEVSELYSELENIELISDKSIIIPKLSELLINAVKKRVKGKVGIAFSGGVDSTLMAFICSKLNIDFVLYNVGVTGAADLEWAKKIADYYKWNLKQIEIDIKKAEETIQKVVKIIPDPSVVKVGVACPELLVLEEAKKDKCDVVLGGLGSEEIFAGYDRHLKAKDKHNECWNGLKGIYEKDLSRDLAVIESVEINVACPYLDKELVKFAMTIDPILKINDKEKKIILREAAVYIGLNKEFACRPKKAAQYGSNFDKVISKLTKKNGFEFKKDYLESLK